MERDPNIQKVFEVCDDSLQAIQGYHLYTINAQRSSDKEKIAALFPNDRIRITFAWDRFYDKRELIDFFSSDIFDPIQTQVSLIYITSVFDDVLSRFIQYLNEKGFPQKCPSNYKNRLMWAYTRSKRCPLSAVGNVKTLGNLPITFGMIDNARRLRNLIVHNHGLFETKYETDAISFEDGIRIQLHPLYSEFKKNPRRSIPAIIVTNDLRRFIWAHIEVLHVLHNSIQEEFFGVPVGYSYQEEEKPIEYKRILFGTSDVEI